MPYGAYRRYTDDRFGRFHIAKFEREMKVNMGYEELKKAQIDQEAVEFSERLAIENPGMYSPEEMRDLVERHIEATALTDKTMREDLESMPPEMQAKIKEMPKSSDVPLACQRVTSNGTNHIR